jgi:hypothetical protein
MSERPDDGKGSGAGDHARAPTKVTEPLADKFHSPGSTSKTEGLNSSFLNDPKLWVLKS